MILNQSPRVYELWNQTTGCLLGEFADYITALRSGQALIQINATLTPTPTLTLTLDTYVIRVVERRTVATLSQPLASKGLDYV